MAKVYLPSHFAADDPDWLAEFVPSVGAADLVTFDGAQLASTLLPIIWDRSTGEHGTLLGHLARANPQWQSTDTTVPALAIVNGPQAYVSPSWYATKHEHGRVVPTWNYVSVHFTGRVTFHQDAEWLRSLVTRLTETHEGHRSAAWAVTDAPAPFIDGQLRLIVGVEMQIERIEAKRKLSQNRSAADVDGVIDGLQREDTPHTDEVAALMNRFATKLD